MSSNGYVRNSPMDFIHIHFTQQQRELSKMKNKFYIVTKIYVLDLFRFLFI